jgi:hypothetical protein
MRPREAPLILEARSVLPTKAMPSVNSPAKSPFLLTLIDLAAVVLRDVFPWTALCIALYLLLQLVETALPPDSDPWITLMTNATRTRALAFIFGFMGALYGIQQRNLRRSTEFRLKSRIAALEREITAMRPHSDS